MRFEPSLKELEMLRKGHPALEQVYTHFALHNKLPFKTRITYVRRTREEQFALWLKGRNPDGSKNEKKTVTDYNGSEKGVVIKPSGVAGTGISQHQLGLAFDIYVQNVPEWQEKDYLAVSIDMLASAKSLKIPLVWGGNFHNPDTPHFELNRMFFKGELK